MKSTRSVFGVICLVLSLKVWSAGPNQLLGIVATPNLNVFTCLLPCMTIQIYQFNLGTQLRWLVMPALLLALVYLGEIAACVSPPQPNESCSS